MLERRKLQLFNTLQCRQSDIFFSVRELNKKLYKYAYTYKNYKWSGMNGFHFKKNTYTLRMVCDETVCKPCLFLEFSRAKKSLFTDCRLGWFIVDTCCIFKSISALKSPECNSANMTRMVREEDKKGRIKKTPLNNILPLIRRTFKINYNIQLTLYFSCYIITISVLSCFVSFLAQPIRRFK